jgi:DNA primase catalytic subunit
VLYRYHIPRVAVDGKPFASDKYRRTGKRSGIISDINAYPEQLALHLIKVDEKVETDLISLSAHFQWVLNKAIHLYARARRELLSWEEAKLLEIGVFSVDRIEKGGCIVRDAVADIEFFNRRSLYGPHPLFIERNSVVNGTERPRKPLYWAENAQEYVVCDYIPEEALITSVKVKDIVEQQCRPLQTVRSIEWLWDDISDNCRKARVYSWAEGDGFLRHAFLLAWDLGQFNKFRSDTQDCGKLWLHLPGDSTICLSWQRMKQRLTEFIDFWLKHVNNASDAALLIKHLVAETAETATRAEMWAYSLTDNVKDIKAYRQELLRKWKAEHLSVEERMELLELDIWEMEMALARLKVATDPTTSVEKRQRAMDLLADTTRE